MCLMEGQKPKIGSAVLVVKDGKFLLGKRNKGKTSKGLWIIPGGEVKFGETTQDAAIREIKEETDLDIEIINLIGFKEIIDILDNYHKMVFFYLATPKHMNIKAKDDISNVGFFSLDEIKNLKIAESVEWVLRKAGFWVD